MEQKEKTLVAKKGYSFKREPCLCCECNYWSVYIDQHGMNNGRCLKGNLAFADMLKCENFEFKGSE